MPKRQIKKPTLAELLKLTEGGKRPSAPRKSAKPRKTGVSVHGASADLGSRQSRLDRILQSGHETAKDERN